MNHRTASVLAAVLALGVGAVAVAGDRPEFPLSVAEARERAEARFQRLDADGNGEISAAEFADADEQRRPRGPHQHRFPGRGPDAAAAPDGPAPDDAVFERLDEDGDGLLSKAEFSRERLRDAGRAEARARRFARLDADGNGSLSRTELPDGSDRLEAMDADGDGQVTREEARQHRQQGPRHGPRDDQRG